MAPASTLGTGERAPDFVLPADDGRQARFYGLAGGRPALLLFDAGPGRDVAAALVETLGARAEVFVISRNPGPGRSGNDLLVLGGAPRPDAAPFRTFYDPGGKVAEGYRLGDGRAPILFVLDPSLRVAGRFEVEDAAAAADRAAGILDAFPTRTPATVTGQAPVLFVPVVLEPKICRFLVEIWQRRGHVETGVEASVGARRADVLEPAKKRRADHTVEDPELQGLLTATLGSRILPEIARAFCYRASRFEGFKIACYDAEAGGHFQAHRDNLSPATAHRRFAVSLNLNTDYEGGEIVFPEYGGDRYRPGEGEALVFSGALLHEVRPVTRGRRFVLL
jgi:hypothetical protein